jgi:Outer membrane protein
MLKRSVMLIMSIAALMFAGVASAELKIGVYDARQILAAMPSVEKEEKKLEAEFEPKQKDIDDKTKSLQKLEEDLKKNAVTYSEEERQAKTLEYQSKRRELQLLAEDTQRLIQLRRNDVVRKIQTELDKEIYKFAEEEGFDLILRSGVLYAGPKVNITQEILKRMATK